MTIAIIVIIFRSLHLRTFLSSAKKARMVRELGNENVTLKCNFAKGQVFCDNSILITLYKIGEVHFRVPLVQHDHFSSFNQSNH